MNDNENFLTNKSQVMDRFVNIKHDAYKDYQGFKAVFARSNNFDIDLQNISCGHHDRIYIVTQ